MGQRVNRFDTPSENSKIYDYFYKEFAVKSKYKISNEYKATIIEEIFKDLDYDFKEAVRIYLRNRNYANPSVWKKYDKKAIVKKFELVKRHMWSPKNIELAVKGYYSNKRLCKTKLTKYDFGDKAYILNALVNKYGIEYKEQLLKHLNNGWFFLWCIPGCGDGARQEILIAIDKWNGKY
jgi:hypothetical protein